MGTQALGSAEKSPGCSGLFVGKAPSSLFPVE